MGWFSKPLTGSQVETTKKLIHHLQTMFAYQQLTMEIYNDAAYSIIGVPQNGAEVSVRPAGTAGTFYNPTLVAERVIPAIEKKINILRLMETKHQLKSNMATGILQEPYQKMTISIQASLERANLQYREYSKWIDNPQIDRDACSLDSFERSAMTAAATALNDLVKKAGITPREWLGINIKAINSVRASIGLSALDNDVFRSRYLRGRKGELVRFFSD